MQIAYQTIASNLLQVCPTDFDRAWLKAKLDEGHAQTECWCESGGQETQPDVPSLATFNMARALHDLRDAMKQDGRAPWRSATFTLFPDGKFKFDVEYDD